MSPLTIVDEGGVVSVVKPRGTAQVRQFNTATTSTSAITIGSSYQYYVFNQNTPSATWTITHNLGRRPSVTVVDSAGTVVIGEVTYTSDNDLVVTFSAGFSGQAYLN